MTTLLFVRHGQASFGQRNYDKLSDLGIKQSKLLGAHYANTGRQIDAVFTGQLKRQKDTAMHFMQSYKPERSSDLGSQLDIDIDDIDIAEPTIITGLNEFDHKDVFAKLKPEFATQAGVMAAIAQAPVPKKRLAELFNESMLRWHSGEYDEDYIESWSTFNQRVLRALQQVINLAAQSQAKSVLVVTSGGVIAAITAGLFNQGSQMAYQINRSLINTGVTTILAKPDKTRLISLNEHSQLYRDGESFITRQ